MKPIRNVEQFKATLKKVIEEHERRQLNFVNLAILAEEFNKKKENKK